MNEPLVRHHWNSALVVLHAATEHRRDRPGQETTNRPVESKCVLVLSLDCALIFPWNSFRASHKFTEAICDPGVTLEVILKEVHVLTFLLLRGDSRRFELEDFLDLALLFVVPLVLLRIVLRLGHPEVVSVIVLRRHFVYYYNLIMSIISPQTDIPFDFGNPFYNGTVGVCVNGTYQGWRDVVYCINPQWYAFIGLSMVLGISVIGAAW